jgi:hypothetical protein
LQLEVRGKLASTSGQGANGFIRTYESANISIFSGGRASPTSRASPARQPSGEAIKHSVDDRKWTESLEKALRVGQK